MKKMAKDLGLDTRSRVNAPQPAATPSDWISGLAGIAKNLNPDQISGIVAALTGNGDGGEELPPLENEGSGGFNLQSLLKFAQENPEIARGFIQKAAELLPASGGAGGAAGAAAGENFL